MQCQICTQSSTDTDSFSLWVAKQWITLSHLLGYDCVSTDWYYICHSISFYFFCVWSKLITQRKVGHTTVQAVMYHRWHIYGIRSLKKCTLLVPSTHNTTVLSSNIAFTDLELINLQHVCLEKWWSSIYKMKASPFPCVIFRNSASIFCYF